jgi:hypothetical protein
MDVVTRLKNKNLARVFHRYNYFTSIALDANNEDYKNKLKMDIFNLPCFHCHDNDEKEHLKLTIIDARLEPLKDRIEELSHLNYNYKTKDGQIIEGMGIGHIAEIMEANGQKPHVIVVTGICSHCGHKAILYFTEYETWEIDEYLSNLLDYRNFIIESGQLLFSIVETSEQPLPDGDLLEEKKWKTCYDPERRLYDPKLLDKGV